MKSSALSFQNKIYFINYPMEKEGQIIRLILLRNFRSRVSLSL